MDQDHPQTITMLLAAHARGEEGATKQLFTRVYDRLRILARRQLRLHGGRHALSTTTLVHESYLKLTAHEEGTWNDHRHFFAVAATAMRQILVDEARKRKTQKRGANAPHVTLQESMLLTGTSKLEILDLDSAMSKLATLHPRLSHLIELRFFAGLSIHEAADVLCVSTRTVDRDWQKAKALLHLFISENLDD